MGTLSPRMHLKFQFLLGQRKQLAFDDGSKYFGFLNSICMVFSGHCQLSHMQRQMNRLIDPNQRMPNVSGRCFAKKPYHLLLPCKLCMYPHIQR